MASTTNHWDRLDDESAHDATAPAVWHGEPPDDLYEVLQVSPRASLAVIRAAYRTLARNHHPDVSDTPGSVYNMRHLNEAYDVLSDPERRARYHTQYVRTRRETPIESTTRRTSPTRPPHTKRLYEPRPAPVRSVEQRTIPTVIARVVAVAALVAVVALGVLLLWLAIGDDDVRSPGTFRPRAGVLEIAPVKASSGRSLTRCGPGWVDVLWC